MKPTTTSDEALQELIQNYKLALRVVNAALRVETYLNGQQGAELRQALDPFRYPYPHR